MANNELTLHTDNTTPTYCSFTADTKEAKIQLYKAMTSADKKLSDCINNTIMLKDVFMEVAGMVNKETGDVNDVPRIVLFDENGVSYGCASFGIYNALKRLFVVFGEPTWIDPIPVKVVQINSKDKKMLSLEVTI